MTRSQFQSTLADELGRILGLPVIHLDRVFWKPGWTEPSTEEFVNRLRFQLNEYKNGWVVDGSYSSRLRGELDDVTDIICECYDNDVYTYNEPHVGLDTPFLLYFPRLVKRTLLRLVDLEVPCAPGCEETFRNIFLSRNSILWFAITNHIPLKRRETERLRTRGVHTGGIARRIGGWGNELNAWKRRVQELGKKHSE